MTLVTCWQPFLLQFSSCGCRTKKMTPVTLLFEDSGQLYKHFVAIIFIPGLKREYFLNTVTLCNPTTVRLLVKYPRLPVLTVLSWRRWRISGLLRGRLDDQSDSLWTVVVVEYEAIKSVPFHLEGRKQEDKHQERRIITFRLFLLAPLVLFPHLNKRTHKVSNMVQNLKRAMGYSNRA